MAVAVAMDLNWDFIAGYVGSSVRHGLWVGLAAALVLSSTGRAVISDVRSGLLWHDRAYLAWIGLLVTSVLWSLSALATIRSVLPLAFVWLVAHLLRRTPSFEAVRGVLFVAVVVAVLSLVVVPIIGELAFQPVSTTGAPELRGIFRHQLRLGAFLALSLGLIIIAWARGDLDSIRTRSSVFNVSVVVLLVAVLVMSRTRTYSGAAVAALVLTLLFARCGRRTWAMAVGSACAVLLVISRLDELGRGLRGMGFDTTLSGRFQVWRRTLRGVTEGSRWFGHGFGTQRLPEFDFLYSAKYRPANGHSSFVQALFETGIVGLVALIALIGIQLVVAWRHSVRCGTFSYSLFLVLYVALTSITGVNYAGTLSTPFCLMMLFLAIESREVPAEARPEASANGVKR